MPPARTTGQPLAYELRFLLWYDRLPAHFDARTIERDPGGRDPDAPPPPMAALLPRAPVGPVTPDPLGKAERQLVAPGIPLDRIAGGELHLVATTATGTTARYVVIDGRVGNLPDASGAEPPLAVPTGATLTRADASWAEGSTLKKDGLPAGARPRVLRGAGGARVSTDPTWLLRVPVAHVASSIGGTHACG